MRLTDTEREYARQVGRDDQQAALLDGWCDDPISDGWAAEAGSAHVVSLLTPGLADRLRRELDPAGDLLDDEFAEAIEERHPELREPLADAYDDGAREAHAQADQQRRDELEAAGAEGWRVCVYGLPGSSVHRWELASPGEADAVVDRLYQPGPTGPYDSEILTPGEAAERTYQDGTPIYGRTWEGMQAD
ncbi:MAG: hypothetical protein ACLFV3_09210 [Phycisphaeraceae bacterium]